MADVNKIKLPDNSEYNIKDYRIPGIDTTPTPGSDNIITSGGVHKDIEDASLVVSTALNDLNVRVSEIEGASSVSQSDYDDDQEVIATALVDLDSRINNIESSPIVNSSFDSIPTENSTNLVNSGSLYTVITQNELVTSAALNDLNDRVLELQDSNDKLVSDSVWEAGTGTNSAVLKGNSNIVSGIGGTAEGYNTLVGEWTDTTNTKTRSSDSTSGSWGHAEGNSTIASGRSGAHAEGNMTLASGADSHAEGTVTIASGNHSHAEGRLNIASGNNGSHAEGISTIAYGDSSHSENEKTAAIGRGSHAEGFLTTSIGRFSHVENGSRVISGNITGDANATVYTITNIEFNYLDWLIQQSSIDVVQNLFSNNYIYITTASTNLVKINQATITGTAGSYILTVTLDKTLSESALSNVECCIFAGISYGKASHSEGASVSYGELSHSEGISTFAIGFSSHTEGNWVNTKNEYEHAQGRYNLSTKTSDTFGNAGNTHHSIGIGTSNSPKNAEEIMQNGDMYLYGVGSYDGTNYSSASTVQEVINTKQDALVSGTNIKTINGQSIVGSGDITITGGGSGSGKGIESVTTTQTGDVIITLENNNVITIDLNHTHSQYLKYQYLESEIDMPVNPDSDTLYLIKKTE